MGVLVLLFRYTLSHFYEEAPGLDTGIAARTVDRFVAHCETQGYSAHTQVRYRAILTGFHREVGKEPGVVTQDDIEDWLAIDCARLAITTRRTIVSTLRSYFGWLHARGKVESDPAAGIPYPRRPRRRPTYLTPEQVALVIRQPTQPRDRLLVTLLARHGQRVGAVIGLRWTDVDFGRALVHYPVSKGQLRSMPLDPDTGRLLKAWRALEDGEWVFPSAHGGPVSYDRARQLCKAACKQAGVPWRGCHEFRRSLATTLLQSGEPLHKVSRLVLGHADIATTVRHYAGAEDDDVAGMLRRLPY